MVRLSRRANVFHQVWCVPSVSWLGCCFVRSLGSTGYRCLIHSVVPFPFCSSIFLNWSQCSLYMVHQSKYGKPLYVLVTAFLQRAIASKRFLKHAPSFFREKKTLCFSSLPKMGSRSKNYRTTLRFVKFMYEYMKIIYENCGVKNCMKEDQRSYRHNFCSCKKKTWKKIQACTGFEPLTSAKPVQRSIN